MKIKEHNLSTNEKYVIENVLNILIITDLNFASTTSGIKDDVKQKSTESIFNQISNI